jgi:hypothetical protein
MGNVLQTLVALWFPLSMHMSHFGIANALVYGSGRVKQIHLRRDLRNARAVKQVFHAYLSEIR